MKDIKIGVIGAGWMAQQHLPVLSAISGVKVAGITSRTLSKAQAQAQEFNVDCCAVGLEEMVSEARPDALLVLVSEESMFGVCERLLNEHRLPLFIEKPAGLALEETERLAGIARANRIPTMVGFNRRYYSIFHKGIEIIRQHGKLRGVIVEGHERMWRVRQMNKFSDRVLDNWIYANSTHTIDLLRLFGGEPFNISAITHSRIEKKGDQIAAIMEFDSGAIGNYSAHWYSPGGWRVVLYGDEVTVEFKPLESGRWIDKDFKVTEIVPDEVDVKFKPGLYRQMEAFVRLVRDGTKDSFALDLEGAYKTMLLTEKLCLSEGK